MVDKINGNSSYDFPGSQKRKNPALKAYENTPGSKDAAGKRTAGSAGKNSADAFDRKESGVILDLSGKAAGKKKNPAASRKKDAFWKDALRKLTAPVVRWLKDFWNSDSSGKISVSSDTDSEGAMHTEPSADGLASMQLDTDAEDPASMQLDRGRMQQTPGQSVQRTDAEQDLKALADRAVKSGDLRQIERVLTQNGAKRLAHNSDLLTYYDRRGKFVEMDETEKHRVLFGDKNVLKL